MSDAPLPRRPRRGNAGRHTPGSEELPFGSLYDLGIIEAVLFAGAREEEPAEEDQECRPKEEEDASGEQRSRCDDGE